MLQIVERVIRIPADGKCDAAIALIGAAKPCVLDDPERHRDRRNAAPVPGRLKRLFGPRAQRLVMPKWQLRQYCSRIECMRMRRETCLGRCRARKVFSFVVTTASTTSSDRVPYGRGDRARRGPGSHQHVG